MIHIPINLLQLLIFTQVPYYWHLSAHKVLSPKAYSLPSLKSIQRKRKESGTYSSPFIPGFRNLESLRPNTENQIADTEQGLKLHRTCTPNLAQVSSSA